MTQALREFGAEVAPADIRRRAALTARARPLELSADRAQAVASLLPALPPHPGAPWLHLTLNGAPLALQIPFGALRRAAGTVLEGLPGEEAALLAEDALAPWLDEAEATLGISLRFQQLAPNPPAAPGLLWGWGVQGISAQGARFRQAGALAVPDGTLEALAAALAPLRVDRAELPGLWLRAELEHELTALPLSELRSLRPGDALLLDPDHPAARLVIENQLSAAVAPRDADG